MQDYDDLTAKTTEAGLGTDLVVQTAYGDSGKTTFFIDDESGWKKHRKDIVGHEVKVMKRINNRPVAVEAVLTRCGTIVGPFMTELTGHAKLTPYRGGWCGNEMFPDVLSDELRVKAGDLVRKLGDRLSDEGYRGFFEVDVLVDVDTDEVYLGELNPRISGASAITNVTAGAYADVPLFAFHLLEFSDVDFDLDTEEINERWRDLAADDQWSHMIVKETSPMVELITAAAPTGQYNVDASGRVGLPPAGAGLAPAAERIRGLLPAHLWCRRLPLEGRRPRRDRHQGPAAARLRERLGVAHHPGEAPDRLDPDTVRRAAAHPARSFGHPWRGQVGSAK